MGLNSCLTMNKNSKNYIIEDGKSLATTFTWLSKTFTYGEKQQFAMLSLLHPHICQHIDSCYEKAAVKCLYSCSSRVTASLRITTSGLGFTITARM